MKKHYDFRKIEIIRQYDENTPAVHCDDNGIFDPFFTTIELGKGTGLGLSVSYFIISDQHNGIMEVNSVPGEWTRFTIKLPLE